ncbi:MAG: DUF1330 domain-containing protein [Burkholderiales bacterium]|nr:DUF1330 domain-containing protein [Burkholderiales bacterium]
MSAYCIANVDVTDPVAYENYRSRTLATVEKYGGRFIVRGGKAEAKEGSWTPHRVVVLEFPDVATANRWYHSPDYQAIIGFRTASARSDVVIVEGV